MMGMDANTRIPAGRTSVMQMTLQKGASQESKFWPQSLFQGLYYSMLAMGQCTQREDRLDGSKISRPLSIGTPFLAASDHATLCLCLLMRSSSHVYGINALQIECLSARFPAAHTNCTYCSRNFALASVRLKHTLGWSQDCAVPP